MQLEIDKGSPETRLSCTYDRKLNEVGMDMMNYRFEAKSAVGMVQLLCVDYAMTKNGNGNDHGSNTDPCMRNLVSYVAMAAVSGEEKMLTIDQERKQKAKGSELTLR